MTAYMVNGHGFELLHTDAVPLGPDERVILLCDWGCILEVKNLFSTFIYTHVAKAKDEKDLIALLLEPGSKGRKYEPLSFIQHIMCEFRDAVPEIELELIDKDQMFRSGLQELPVIAYDSRDKRASAKQLEDPFVPLHNVSYYYNADDKPEHKILLSELLERIRERTGGPFTLVAFVCRDIVSKVTSPRKLRELKAETKAKK